MIKPVKVLCIIDSLGYGGAERLIVSILPHMIENNIQVDVVSLSSDLPLFDELKRKNINVMSISPFHRWSVIEIMYKIFNICRNGDYDVVWGHLYFGNLYSALIGRFLPKIKVVWTLHSPRKCSISSNKVWNVIRDYIEVWLGQNLTHSIVSVSNAVAGDYRSTTSWNKINVIHNAIDFSVFPVTASYKEIRNMRYKYDIPYNDFLIVTPGRFSPEKGHKVMVLALLELGDKCSKNISWIAVGGGCKKNILDFIQKNKTHCAIKLLDALPHCELLKLVQISNLVVIPSIRESFGIAAVEAMGLSVPVIASDIDGLSEVVTDATGIKVEVGDSTELMNAILLICSESNRDINKTKTMVVSAKEYAMNNFDIKPCAKKWSEVIKETL
mgnify:FL=1